MRRLTLPIALAILLLAYGTAGAATTHVVRGAGYGHGVGLSQYGAKGFAEHGYDYKQILSHYYAGTELGQAEDQPIRVLLQSGPSSISFKGATKTGERDLSERLTYSAVRKGGAVELRHGDELVGAAEGGVAVSHAGGAIQLLGRAINGISSGSYRDTLEFRPNPSGGGLIAVNAVSLDDYVRGVVAGEMPASWHPEALKAQAVVARSYSLTTDAGGVAFDQYPDTRSQVYKGVVGEHPNASAAVSATAGQILRSQGAAATTFFFSTSGGKTEHVENVFYTAPARLYLRSVDDPFDRAAPRHRWRLRFSHAQLQAKLGSFVKGKLRKVEVVQRGASPRIVAADVVGSKGKKRVRGTDLKARLGLYDTWAYFTAVRSASRARTSWVARLVRPHRLVGAVDPAPRRRAITVERRGSKGRWRAHRRARTGKSGAYAVTLRRAGVYRVRAGRVVGSPVRVP